MARSPQTLRVEALLKAGQSLKSIARDVGISRQRVQYIQRRLLTTSSLQPHAPAQMRVSSCTSEEYEVGNESLRLKPVNNRRSRPAWALDDKQLMLKCIGERHMLRYKIADMYWRKNMSAKDIATSLDVKVKKVEDTVRRLVGK